jgi:hypothetical protein
LFTLKIQRFLYCLLLQKLFLLASNKKVERAVLRTALVINVKPLTGRRHVCALKSQES